MRLLSQFVVKLSLPQHIQRQHQFEVVPINLHLIKIRHQIVVNLFHQQLHLHQFIIMNKHLVQFKPLFQIMSFRIDLNYLGQLLVAQMNLNQ